MGYIFISYSHKDKEYVHKLSEHLFSYNLNVWIDSRINYGSRWEKEIKKQVTDCSAFILIMSPNSEESKWVQNELGWAQELEKTIYPILLDGENWRDVEGIQYLDVRHKKMPPSKFITSLVEIVRDSGDKSKSEVSVYIGGNVEGTLIIGNDNSIQSSENSNREEEKRETELNRLANSALQYEKQGHFDDAIKALHNMKKIAPYFSQIDIQIKKLENKIAKEKARQEAEIKAKAERETKLKNMENSAIQYELRGNFSKKVSENLKNKEWLGKIVG